MTAFSRYLARLLRTRWPARGAGLLAVLFLIVSLVLLAQPLIPQLFGSGKDMDYLLWFKVGQRMLHDGPLQEDLVPGTFDFLYPPFAALLLAVPAYFGATAMVVFLALVNLASWWAAIVLSSRLSGATQPVSPWVIALPVTATLPFVYDQFNLGQPNLMLLVLMMDGFLLLRRGSGWLAGLPFAIAAAIKAFPVLIFPYLLWRGFWRTAASTAVLMVVLLVVLPGGLRGFERNWKELGQWTHGMLMSTDESGFAQRNYSWGWKNQSLYSVEHRLLRPLNAEPDPDQPAPPIYVNLFDLDQRTADVVFVATAIVIGVGFILLMPPRRRRTPRSDIAEWSILMILILIATPVARAYYFVWLLWPYIVLTRWAATEPDRKLARITWIAIALSLVLLAAGTNGIRPHWTQAAGLSLPAVALLIAALTVLMRRSALPPPMSSAAADVRNASSLPRK
jgi:hypothetical protein